LEDSIKEGADGQLSLFFETGPGLTVALQLRQNVTMAEAQELVHVLCNRTSAVMRDFSYSPGA